MQTHSATAVRIAQAVLPLIGVCAPLLALVRIVRSSVNVPYSDDWDLTVLSASMRTGTLNWQDIWAPHNGHRQLVGNVVFLVLDRLGGWNVVREELVGLACLIAGLIALYRLLQRTMEPLAAGAVFAVASWLIAGPILYESLLISSNVGWPVSSAALLIAVERLSAPSATRRNVAGIVTAVTAALIGSFAQVPGLLIWPCGLLILLGKRASRTAIASWCGAWACTLALYAAGYPVATVSAAGASGRAQSLTDAFAYALVFLGTPLRSAEMSLRALAIAGASIAVAFVLAAGSALRIPNERDRAWPWIAFGAYALGGSVLTAFTRAGLGEYQAMSPRYISMSAFLLVALLGLTVPRLLSLLTALPHPALPRTSIRRAAAAAVAAVLLVQVIRSERLGSTVWRDFDYHRGVALQGLARNDPATFWESYPDRDRLRTYLDALRRVDDGPLAEVISDGAVGSSCGRSDQARCTSARARDRR